MKTLVWVRSVTSVAMLAAMGCSAHDDRAPIEETSASQKDALTTSFHYFRCNATGWDVSDRTRLAPTHNPRVFELELDVHESWMVTHGDDCVITETPARNAWGDWQKYYGAYDPLLEAPSSGRIRLEDATPANGLKIRYPSTGRYRVRVNLAEKYVAVTKASPPGSGDVVWTSSGSLSTDTAGRLYRTTYIPSQPPTQTLARVDKVTGDPIWHRAMAQTYSFDPTCALADVLVVRDGGLLVALDPATGAARWSTDLGGDLTAAGYFYPRCRADLDAVYVTYGERSERVAALRRTTGERLWTYQGPSYVSIQSMSPTAIVLSSYDAETSRLAAVDPATGAERWAIAQQAWVSIQSDEADRLYRTSAREVARLDAASGSVLWTVQTESEYPWLSFENGGVYLHDASRLAKLAPSTGSDVWSFSHAGTSPPSALALRSGAVLVYSTDPSGTLSLTLLSNADGRALWSRQLQASGAWPTQDKQGRLYVVSRSELSRLDNATGATVWTYTYPITSTDYFSGGLRDIAESDSQSVYVLASGPGYRYAPMALLALDLASGTLKWRHDERGGIYVLGSDDARLYAMTGYFGGVPKVFLK